MGVISGLWLLILLFNNDCDLCKWNLECQLIWFINLWCLIIMLWRICFGENPGTKENDWVRDWSGCWIYILQRGHWRSSVLEVRDMTSKAIWLHEPFHFIGGQIMHLRENVVSERGTDSLEFTSELPLLRMGVCVCVWKDSYHSSYFVTNWTENAMLFRSELCDFACKILCKAEDSSFYT